LRLHFIEVDVITNRLPDGRDYLGISPQRLLPALRLHDGFLLTEDAAILQHLTASVTTTDPAALTGPDFASLRRWLFMLGTQLRDMVSAPLADNRAAVGAETHTRDSVVATLDFLDDQLTQRQFLLDRFGVSDAYLCSVLNSTAQTGLDLSPWPEIEAYYARLLKRPSVSRAIAEELALHRAASVQHRSVSESLGKFT
jgi:glutathione S-transferase